MLFSCCCGKAGSRWTPVCDCYNSTYLCDRACLDKQLLDSDLYYDYAIVKYPNSYYIYIFIQLYL